jgi:putative Holliday junction resolvase
VSATLAIDYGRKRIGLALSDPMGITVRGLETAVGGPTPEAAAMRIAEVVRAHGAGVVVVGLPLHASGDESEISGEVRRFAAELARILGHDVELHDEELTSWEAEQTLKRRGIDLKKARREGLIDREAACALLRSWLSSSGG